MGGGGLWKERGGTQLKFSHTEGGGGIKSLHPWGGGRGVTLYREGGHKRFYPFLRGR